MPRPSPPATPSSRISSIADWCRRAGREFKRTRRSAVALELAAVALPFFILLLGVMETAYDIFLQSALNSAVSQTARQIWTGKVQDLDSSQGGAAFVSSYFCPNISGMLDCNSTVVKLNIQHVTSGDLYAGTTPAMLSYVTGRGPSATLAVNSSWFVCTGGPGAEEFFQAVYAGPTFVGGFIPSFVVTYNGGLVHPTYASDAFVNQVGFTATISC